jgi:hypothetical protein
VTHARGVAIGPHVGLDRRQAVGGALGAARDGVGEGGVVGDALEDRAVGSRRVGADDERVRRQAGAGQELRRHRAAVRGGDVREGGVEGQVVLSDLDAQLGIDDGGREVGMDDWPGSTFSHGSARRTDLPICRLLCIATGPTYGRAWSRAPPARNYAKPPRKRPCAAGSHQTNSGTRMPSRWPAKASR